MSKDDYRRALESAVREYEKLIAQQADLEGRISQLRHSIAALTKLCGYEPTVPIGLTDACRLVLRNAQHSLTALEVRDRLVSIGVDLGKYSNPLSSIHTVLKRMHEAGEVKEDDRRESSRTAYSSAARKRRTPGEGLCPPKDRRR